MTNFRGKGAFRLFELLQADRYRSCLYPTTYLEAHKDGLVRNCLIYTNS